MPPFVPDDFEVPGPLAAERFRLEPLGPEHNERDHAAWSSSIEHIRRTPGYPDGRWPRPMTLEQNLADLERHARDFAERRGFTYTVLEAESDDVIGCVYVYPAPDGRTASLRSWVRADRAELDAPLRDAVERWLRTSWPFPAVDVER